MKVNLTSDKEGATVRSDLNFYILRVYHFESVDECNNNLDATLENLGEADFEIIQLDECKIMKVEEHPHPMGPNHKLPIGKIYYVNH